MDNLIEVCVHVLTVISFITLADIFLFCANIEFNASNFFFRTKKNDLKTLNELYSSANKRQQLFLLILKILKELLWVNQNCDSDITTYNKSEGNPKNSISIQYLTTHRKITYICSEKTF